MRVVAGYPPNVGAIDAAFHIIGRPVIFAWGDRIFNPMGIVVPPELIAHEKVHGQRQGADVDGWWARYIADPSFRLAEEIPAHQVEFESLCEQHRRRWVSARNMRRTYAAHVARKLSAPLYGKLIAFDAAKQMMLAA